MYPPTSRKSSRTKGVMTAYASILNMTGRGERYGGKGMCIACLKVSPSHDVVYRERGKRPNECTLSHAARTRVVDCECDADVDQWSSMVGAVLSNTDSDVFTCFSQCRPASRCSHVGGRKAKRKSWKVAAISVAVDAGSDARCVSEMCDGCGDT